MKLPDDVIIYPGHGKGTQCGKNLSSETKSTIGKQKLLNYALKFKINMILLIQFARIFQSHQNILLNQSEKISTVMII